MDGWARVSIAKKSGISELNCFVCDATALEPMPAFLLCLELNRWSRDFNMYWKSADQTPVLGLNADTRLLVVGPLYHVGALDLPGIAVLWHGGLLSIHRNFEPEQALAAIEAEKLSAAWFAPVMYGLSTGSALIRSGAVRNAVVVGADALSQFMPGQIVTSIAADDRVETKRL